MLTTLALTTILYTGTLTEVHSCVDYDCRLISRPRTTCQVRTRFDLNGRFGEVIGSAEAFGHAFEQHWFQTGDTDGTHGQNGMLTLTLFFKGKLKTAYYSEYSDRRTYKRFTCRF